MSSIGLYFRGLSKKGVNALRARLNDLAATFGYTALGGPTFGQGNLAAMLVGIDAGELALVLLSDEQFKLAIEALDQLATDLPSDNWAKAIANSLRAAYERRS